MMITGRLQHYFGTTLAVSSQSISIAGSARLYRGGWSAEEGK